MKIVRANGETLRWFGEERRKSLRTTSSTASSPATSTSRTSSFPAGSEQLQALAAGYAEGVNRYLNETGVDNLPEGAGGLSRRRLGSGDRRRRPRQGVPEADSPRGHRNSSHRSSLPRQRRQRCRWRHAAPQLPERSARASRSHPPSGVCPEETAMGSNAYGIGAELARRPATACSSATRTSRGAGPASLVHSAPHDSGGLRRDGRFASGCSCRQHRVQLEPRVVAHGVDRPTLHRSRAPTRRRQPDASTSYDDEIRDIETFDVTIEVMLENGDHRGTRRADLHDALRPHRGPRPGQRVARRGWPTATNTLFAIGDANIDNTRALNQFQQMGQSQCVAELEESLKLIGLPWVNTIAADRDGTGYYADISTVPNVSAEKLEDCSRQRLLRRAPHREPLLHAQRLPKRVRVGHRR